MSRRLAVVLFVVFAVLSTRPRADHDPDYAARVKDWTTKPEFISLWSTIFLRAPVCLRPRTCSAITSARPNNSLTTPMSSAITTPSQRIPAASKCCALARPKKAATPSSYSSF